jgi:hypothetical protein
MSIESRLKASLNLLFQISQLIGLFRLSDLEEDVEYTPKVTLTTEQDNIVRRFRSNAETKVQDLTSELVNIIQRFRINNQSMTDAELRKISEELSCKWAVGMYDYIVPTDPSLDLLLSLDLFQVIETLLQDFGDSKFLLWRIESINLNFLQYLYIMYAVEIQDFVQESIVSLKETALIKE